LEIGSPDAAQTHAGFPPVRSRIHVAPIVPVAQVFIARATSVESFEAVVIAVAMFHSDFNGKYAG